MNEPFEVIIADDHPIFRRGLMEVLRQDASIRLAGEAGDGETALHLIETVRPKLAILDIHMPKLSGLEVARVLWQRQFPVKLVLLTMYEEQALFDAAMNLGVAAYVVKDNAVTDIVTAVHSVAAGKIFVSPSLSALILKRNAETAALRREKPGLERLTPAERRILKLIAEDRTTKEIAAALGISVRTVDTHRQNISHKLELSGTHSLLKFAYDNKSAI